MLRNLKKAQMSNNMLFYVIAAVVLALIIGYGYNSVRNSIANADTLLYISFKNNLEQSITRLQGDAGALSRDVFKIPNDYYKICFINWQETPVDPSIIISGDPNFVPVIYDSWDVPLDSRSNNNIFLIGKKAVNFFHIEHVYVNNNGNNWVCLTPVAGTVKIKLNNSGDNIIVGEW